MNKTVNARAKQNTAPSRQRLLDRYKQHLQHADLKMSAGDRIGAENDLQHAEHFFRSANEENAPTDHLRDDDNFRVQRRE